MISLTLNSFFPPSSCGSIYLWSIFSLYCKYQFKRFCLHPKCPQRGACLSQRQHGETSTSLCFALSHRIIPLLFLVDVYWLPFPGNSISFHPRLLSSLSLPLLVPLSYLQLSAQHQLCSPSLHLYSANHITSIVTVLQTEKTVLHTVFSILVNFACLSDAELPVVVFTYWLNECMHFRNVHFFDMW